MPEEISLDAIMESAPNAQHKAMSEWLTAETGKKVSPSVIALVLRAYPLYRQTEAYAGVRESISNARQAQNDDRAARVAERNNKRLAKLRKELATAEAKANGQPVPDDEPAPRKPAAKKAARTRTPAQSNVRNIDERPARGSGAGSVAVDPPTVDALGDEDDPF